MASHEIASASDEWYTPPWVFEKLGIEFDCDPCSPGADIVPWIPAAMHGTKEQPIGWTGKVWLNPPYGKRNSKAVWLDSLAEYGNGIALVPNRTGTDWFQDAAEAADCCLFVRGKIKFIDGSGNKGKSPGYGNVLMAFGKKIAEALYDCQIDGIRQVNTCMAKGLFRRVGV